MSLQKGFRFRSFVSLLTGFSFLMVVISGIVLYISPPGRIANWTTWTFWKLSKHQWGALHICFSAACIIASGLHIWLNRKPLLSYFAGKIQSAGKLRIEWVVVLIICAVIFGGSLKPFAPFSFLLDLNEHVKYSWAVPNEQPPIPHAELLTVEELAKEAGVKIETVLQNLKSKDIEVAASDIFGEIAERANLSPNELYEMVLGKSRISFPSEKHEGGGGFGQKTLRQVCREMNLSPQNAVDILKTAGITASADETIRTIADRNNAHPSEIRQLLQEQ